MNRWLAQRYPGENIGLWEMSDSGAGHLLLAARALSLSFRQRAELVADERIGLAESAARLVMADASDGGPEEDRMWAAMLRAEAAHSDTIPPPWQLPITLESLERLNTAATQSDVSPQDFTGFALYASRLSEEARSVLLQDIGVSPDDDDMSMLDEDQRICADCGCYDGEEGFNPTDEDILAAQADSDKYFPEEVRGWVQHIETIVTQNEKAILMVTGVLDDDDHYEDDDESSQPYGDEDYDEVFPNSGFSVDLHHNGQGVQWGYSPHVKRQAGEIMRAMLEDGKWAGATLRVFTGKKDDIIGEAVKELRGWKLEISDLDDIVAKGIEPQEMQEGNERSGATGEQIEPEFGAEFPVAEDISKSFS